MGWSTSRVTEGESLSKVMSVLQYKVGKEQARKFIPIQVRERKR